MKHRTQGIESIVSLTHEEARIRMKNFLDSKKNSSEEWNKEKLNKCIKQLLVDPIADDQIKSKVADRIFELEIPVSHFARVKKIGLFRQSERGGCYGLHDPGLDWIFLAPYITEERFMKTLVHEIAHAAYKRGLKTRGIDLREIYRQLRETWRIPNEKHWRENEGEFFAKLYEVAFTGSDEDRKFWGELLGIKLTRDSFKFPPPTKTPAIAPGFTLKEGHCLAVARASKWVFNAEVVVKNVTESPRSRNTF